VLVDSTIKAAVQEDVPLQPVDESLIDTSEASVFIDEKIRKIAVGQARSLRLDTVFDADKQTFTAASVRRASLAKRKKLRQQQLANSADLIVSRNIATGLRRILTSESASSMMSHISNAFVYSPATYLELEIDKNSTSGRSEAIAEQAHKLSLITVWDSIVSMDKPIVKIAKLDGPATDAELLVPFQRSLDVTTVPIQRDEYGILPESVEALERARLHKLLGFRRPDDSEQSSRNYMLPIVDAQEVEFLRMKQVPGIVDFISRGYGSKSIWQSPLSSHAVRVYASSVLDACSIDALVQRFQDHHSPFFMTRDEPQQFVTLAFSSVLFVPTGYSIGSTHPIVGGLYPRSWRVEASVDGGKWTVLRRHDDDRTLDRHSPTAYWDLMPPKKSGQRFFQQFRLVQEGLNARGTNNFCVCSVELYGRMIYVTPKATRIPLNVKDIRIKKRKMGPFTPLPQAAKPPGPAPSKKK
jgi:hypothetical protein